MQTNSTFHNSTLHLIIDGHVSGISEVMTITNIFSEYSQARVIELEFNDAFVIPSALIGHLLKLVNVDQKKVMIKAKRHELKDLINDLNLNTAFDVR